MYFESHAHYDDIKYKSDRDELIASLPENGVDIVINVGADMASSRESIKLAEKYSFIYAAVGVHPDEVELMKPEDITKLEDYTKHEKVVAIGEIGLDYSRKGANRDNQIYWFKEQLALAERLDIPVIIHSRDAAAETFEIIKASKVRRGVLHCYSASVELGLEYVKLGFYIGIGGVVTFKNAKKLVEAVEILPIERILIETDCPYLAPDPERGLRNDSTKLKYIVDKIAEIKNISHKEVINMTGSNGVDLFLRKL